jgi:hypothetical protein
MGIWNLSPTEHGTVSFIDAREEFVFIDGYCNRKVYAPYNAFLNCPEVGDSYQYETIISYPRDRAVNLECINHWYGF